MSSDSHLPDPAQPFNPWLQRLALPLGQPAPAHTAPRSEQAAIQAAAEQLGWAVATLETRDVPDKQQLIERCVQALALPQYFGHNWDALTDALNDLEWLEAKGLVLLLSLPDVPADNMEGEPLGVFLDILAEALCFHAGHGWPFHVVLLRP